MFESISFNKLNPLSYSSSFIKSQKSYKFYLHFREIEGVSIVKLGPVRHEHNTRTTTCATKGLPGFEDHYMHHNQYIMYKQKDLHTLVAKVVVADTEFSQGRQRCATSADLKIPLHTAHDQKRVQFLLPCKSTLDTLDTSATRKVALSQTFEADQFSEHKLVFLFGQS